MRIKLVKFKNGKFAVRKGWFFYKYLCPHGIWWDISSRWYFDCMYSEEVARNKLDLLFDVGEVVKWKPNY